MPFYHHIRKRAKRVKRERRDLSLRTHCKYTGIKGFLTIYNDAVRYQYSKRLCLSSPASLTLAYLITKKALHKYKILIFWEKYGIKATTDAFGVKERTLFYWKALFKKNGKKPEALNEKKTIPKTKKSVFGLMKFNKKLND